MLELAVTLRQLEVLVAVAEAGGFTKAADALRMTQPGVSHTISGLERELGASLIERDRGGVRPTEVGERVLVHAREVLGLVERIGHEAAGSRELRTGKLRIGGFPSATSRILPVLMGAFNARYPGVEITLVEGTDGEVLDLIRSREVDVGFVTLPAGNLETVPVAEDEMLAVLPEGHPLASAGEASLEELAAEPFVMSKGGCEPLISSAFRSAGHEPAVRFEVRDMGTILAMVGEGLGVTVAPELALPQHPAMLEGLRTVPLRPSVRRHLALAVRSLETASPAAAAFVQMALESPRDHPETLLQR
ncbi:MAG: LysR family transcriptional regulator [Actinobacteria bacterium]|nr:LysR substrate-binding domain-containing protein [Actinomycetota bacterium]PLS83079.1 MAG: LysR family transcriptional regulator [Actinomycetota bacterium]